MANTYSYYGGTTTFYKENDDGDIMQGQLRYSSTSDKAILSSGSEGTAVYLGFIKDGSPYPSSEYFNNNFDEGYNQNKLTTDTDGCKWQLYGVNDETASPVQYYIPKNETGSERTIKFKYGDKTMFSIIQKAYSSGTTKVTYTINAIKIEITENALFLASSLNNMIFTCNSNPLMAENDSDEYYAYWVTNSYNSFKLGHIVANQLFRDNYNMKFVSGNEYMFNNMTTDYYNYTNTYINVYNNVTSNLSTRKASISDRITICEVQGRQCTVTDTIQFSKPDFIFTITF